MLTERRVRPRCAFFREKNPEGLTLCLGYLLHPENFLVSSPDLEKFSLFFNPTLISRGTLTWSWVLGGYKSYLPSYNHERLHSALIYLTESNYLMKEFGEPRKNERRFGRKSGLLHDRYKAEKCSFHGSGTDKMTQKVS